MKHAISALALLIGSASLFTAAADNIYDVKDFDNKAVYHLSRLALNTQDGQGWVSAQEGKTQLVAATSAKTDKASPYSQWSIHYSAQEKAYYLYNLGAAQFATGTAGSKSKLTSEAADLVPLYNENIKYWQLDCGGYLLGLKKDYAGKAIFMDDVTDRNAARELGSYFTIALYEDRTLTDEEVAAIEAKIAEGRTAKLADYREFLDDAKNVSTAGSTGGYLGDYDYAALEYALDNPDKYTLAQIEEIYQETLLSRYPKAGHMYRFHNRVRPASHSVNILSTATDGTIRSRNLKTPAFGTAGEGFTDDLAIMRLWPVDGNPARVKVEFPALHKYMKSASSGANVQLTESFDEAYVFELDPVTNRSRAFRLHQADLESWLTVSGDNYLVGYNRAENPNQWYIEEVKTISIPVDANGYATVCLPCGVTLPEGAKAYTVTDFSSAKAYVEEISGPIHMSTPWIVKAPAGATSVELTVENNLNYIQTAMVGNMTVATNVGGRYVPVFSAEGISFAYEPAAESVLPGTCYIASEDLGPVTTVMGANPDAGIEEITTDEAAARKLYDLLGRPVSGTPTPGIYINAVTKKALRVN